MADVTGVFKSTVKMLKVRHKNIATIKGGSDPEQLGIGNAGILPTHKLNGSSGDETDKSFSERTRFIVTNITNLRTFLVKNRKAYMAASSQISLPGGQTKLTEAERDTIDADAMSYIKLCNETLAKYKLKALHKNLSEQHREHRTLVINMVAEYLKVVCQLYAEQKAVRVKRAVDWRKMSRLEILQAPSAQPTSQPRKSSQDGHSAAGNARTMTSTRSQQLLEEETSADAGVDDEVTSEEAQLFKMENEQLYNEMNSTLDEVRQIEGKVVEISRLQHIFTEKVLEQDTDISRIGDEMVHSTENIVQGNDDIREAMKNNAGMRVWIIFGICVLSFTLLFLDWYND